MGSRGETLGGLADMIGSISRRFVAGTEGESSSSRPLPLPLPPALVGTYSQSRFRLVQVLHGRWPLHYSRWVSSAKQANRGA